MRSPRPENSWKKIRRNAPNLPRPTVGCHPLLSGPLAFLEPLCCRKTPVTRHATLNTAPNWSSNLKPSRSRNKSRTRSSSMAPWPTVNQDPGHTSRHPEHSTKLEFQFEATSQPQQVSHSILFHGSLAHRESKPRSHVTPPWT